MALKGNNNEEKIWNYLRDKGINAYGAAGLMGNLREESGLRPNNLQNSCEKRLNITDVEYTRLVDDNAYPSFATDKAGYGLAQWTSSNRKQGLLNFVRSRKCSIADLEAQLDYLWYELNNSYKSVLSAIKSATSVRSASDIVLTQFERPKNQSEAVKVNRASYGQEYYNKYASQNGGKTMANTADKVIQIALAEVGYLEKKDGNNLYDKTANAGDKNYTKYGKEMHEIYPSVMDYPAYWCDAFVDWCFYKAYGVATAKSLLGGNFNDYTVASAEMYKKKNALDTTPKIGAQVFFTKNGQTSGCYHTGIVYAVDGTYFYTVEGNTSGANGVVRNGGGVAKKQYSISAYKGKVLFGHPKYDSVVTTQQTTAAKKSLSEVAKDVKAGKYGNGDARKATLKAAGYTETEIKEIQAIVNGKSQTSSGSKGVAQSFDKAIAGTYTVSPNVGALAMRDGAGKVGTKVIRSVPKGQPVHNYGYYSTVDGVRWLYVEYAGLTGFMSGRYLKKK